MTSIAYSAQAFEKVASFTYRNTEDGTHIKVSKFAAALVLNVTVIAFAALEFVAYSALVIAASPLYYLPKPLNFFPSKTYTNLTSAMRSSVKAIKDASIALVTIRTAKKKGPHPIHVVSDPLRDVLAYVRDKGSFLFTKANENRLATAAVILGAVALYYSPSIIAHFKDNGGDGLSKLRDIPKIFTTPEPTLTEKLWSYKNWIAGGVALTVMGVATTYFLRREVAQILSYEWVASGTKGILTLFVRKSEETPIKATIIFCVDKSTSMTQGTMADEVNEGIEKIINYARKFLSENTGSSFQIGVVGFHRTAEVIVEPTELTPLQDIEDNSTEDLIQRIADSDFVAATSISRGLALSGKQLNGWWNNKGRKVVILLTDGKENVHATDVPSSDEIVREFTRTGGQFFAIGMKGHSQSNLRAIAGNGYRDTTGEDSPSIVEAIEEVYERAIAKFSEIELRVDGVPEGSWYVHEQDLSQNGKVKLGRLSEEESMEFCVEIDGYSLENPLNLEDVSVQIDYLNPSGRKVTTDISWNPDTWVDPAVLNHQIQNT